MRILGFAQGVAKTKTPAIVVGLVCGSVQLPIACCVLAFLSSRYTIVANMNQHTQSETEFSIATTAFINNIHDTPLGHIQPSSSTIAPPPPHPPLSSSLITRLG